VSIAGEAADIVADPSGRYLYTIDVDISGNYHNNIISMFAVTDNGTLAPLSPASVPLPDLSCVADAATIDPAGRFLYVVCEDISGGQAIAQFAIESDGTLSALSPAYISLSASIPVGAARPSHLVLDSSRLHAYLASGTRGVVQFTVGNDGTLSSPSATAVAAVPSVIGFALAPDGQHAYVLGFTTSPTTGCGAQGCTGRVLLFTVASTGVLTATDSSLTIGAGIPLQMLFNPADASIAYLLSSHSVAAGVDAIASTSIVQYAADSSGTLSESTGSAAVSFPYYFLEASVFGASLYTLGTPPGPAIIPPSGLGPYSLGSMGLLTARPVTPVPGMAAGVAFVAAH
jgi:6-phosphogluconolactonase (cycloisomerase 2 family)